MTLGGASLREIALVVFLLVLVVIFPKVPKIGEKIGGLFDARREKNGQNGGRRGRG
jgi:hypothetical protein